MVGAIVQSDPVISVIRRELRKIAAGGKVTEEEIKAILNTEVLKRDVVQGELAEEAMTRIKKAQQKQIRKKIKKSDTEVISPIKSYFEK